MKLRKLASASKAIHEAALGRRWRKQRGLRTISDHVLEYRAKRHPRGPYRTPLPDDRLP